jgi:hypothetical protein
VGFKPQIDAASIVLVGDFNPPIFQPEWFRSHGLIRESEAKAAQERPNFVLAGNLANFHAGPFEVQVTQERFVARVSDTPSFHPLRDLIIGTFDLLEHTPVRLLGLNRMLHYELDTKEEWSKVRHTFAPKENWQGVMDDPEMLSVQMQGQGRVQEAQHFRVKVQPSQQVVNGIYFDCNEQYDARLLDESEPETLSAGRFIEIIDNEWEEALAHAKTSSQTLLKNVFGGDDP